MNTIKFQRLFGERVRMLRKIQKLTQDDLAYKIGRTPNTISNIETGNVFPSVESLLWIAKVLKVEVSELFNVSKNLTTDKKKRLVIEEIINLLQEQDIQTIKAVKQQMKILLELK